MRRWNVPTLERSNVNLPTFALLIFILLLAGCRVVQGAGPVLPVPTTGPASAWFSVYYTVPQTLAGDFSGGPDEALAAAIGGAQRSVDVAAYELDLARVRDALVDAHRRGVHVRMVTDSDSLDGTGIAALKEAGVPILGDRREGLMHHKFVVIDGAEVWAGSMNLTVNDAYRNNNNLFRARSSRLAQDYTAEFEEMFVDDRFGPASRADTPYPAVTVDGTPIEVLFSPDDGVLQRLVELVQGAQESVHILAYSFTSDPLADAILDRARAGVQVAGVFDENQYRANLGADYERFRLEGLDVRLDGNPRFLHHKLLIIDGETVVTGSYNFSRNAENSNDENVLVVHNAEIARQYLEEFGRVYEVAKP